MNNNMLMFRRRLEKFTTHVLRKRKQAIGYYDNRDNVEIKRHRKTIRKDYRQLNQIFWMKTAT
jgi:hypothetical protein